VVKDAQRHGQRVLPVSVRDSEWPCTVEGDAVRLGLRCVKGLRESAARALVAARAARAFTSVHDLAARAGLDRAELATLAAIGALAPLGSTRRASLWVAAQSHPGPLFTVAAGDARPALSVGGLFEERRGSVPATTGVSAVSAASPLREMTDAERLAADYAGTGVTLGRHPMALRRDDLTHRRVVRAADLPRVPGGARVRVAGSVIVRQRPGTAKGFVFLSLEDETGIANVIVTPDLFARRRLALVTAPFLLVEGILQTQDGVVSIRAARVEPLPSHGHAVPSHDFG
jgi:error-prone DNA polymerase